MHWKAHLFRHLRLSQTFPDFFSHPESDLWPGYPATSKPDISINWPRSRSVCCLCFQSFPTKKRPKHINGVVKCFYFIQFQCHINHRKVRQKQGVGVYYSETSLWQGHWDHENYLQCFHFEGNFYISRIPGNPDRFRVIFG